MSNFTGNRPQPTQIEHSVVCRSQDTYCGHPSTCGMYGFGGGELALLHWHAPCRYSCPQDVRHSLRGYKGKAVILLQRSFDGGRTWPPEHNLVVRDVGRPLEEKRKFFFDNPHPRERLDMSGPEAIFHFGIGFAGDPITWVEDPPPGKAAAWHKGDPGHISYVLRSTDKGYSWEKAPFVFRTLEERRIPVGRNLLLARLEDGALLAVVCDCNYGVPKREEQSQIDVYHSVDDGLSWHWLSQVARSQTPRAQPGYPCLVLLPSGRVLCFFLYVSEGPIAVSESDDGGFTWSRPRPIVRLGHSPWRGQPLICQPAPDPDVPAGFVPYRSPQALLLRDGRIVVLYARRRPPFGIGGLLSEDQGRSWSDEFVLRADGTWSDIGYLVATELDDGTIFTAYYYVTDVGRPPYQLVRYIAGTHFRV